MMTIPSILALIFLLFAFTRSTSFLFISAFGFMSLSSLALIPPTMISNVSLLPAPLAFLMIIIKTVTDRVGAAEFFRNAFNLRYLGFLTLYTVVGVVGAFVLPKYLMGQVYVVPIRSDIMAAQPLAPTSSNMTQSVYVTISTLTAISFAVLAKKRNFLEDFKKAIILLAAVAIGTGLLEYTLGLAGQGAVLDIFRTASYFFMLDNVVSGVRRIIGLTSEASVYGALTVTALSLLVFCRNLYDTKTRNTIVLPLAAGCATMAALCTSSTAYVALAVVILMYFWDASSRLGVGTPKEKQQVIGELIGLAAFALFGMIIIIMLDETREIAVKLLDDMVFKKTQSGSYQERKSWNDAALGAFINTYGAGIGFGSARTSNLFLNILTCSGIVGTLFFAAFVFKIIFIKSRSTDVNTKEAIRGAKLTLAPIAVMGYLSGTTSDYGTMTAVLFGIIIGLSTGLKRTPAKTPETAPEINAPAGPVTP
jgi:hypothetical protein